MRAPTPVSSLVHSSTLVTAGISLLINFCFFLLNFLFTFVFLLIGGLTIGIARFLCVFEKDLKKVVALSTLSQMGCCVFFIGLNFFFCFFYIY